jgi:hypothetical protein
MSDWIPVIVALIAAVTALIGYMVNGRLNRISDKMKAYAEALAAVEHYRQLPYMIYRLHDSTPETRSQLAKMIGEAQESLSFHRRWLDLGSPAVGSAYNALVYKVRENNFRYRQQAWEADPPSTDRELEKHRDEWLTNTKDETDKCLIAMRNELKFTRRRHSHISHE